MALWRPLRVQIIVGQQDVFSRVLVTNIECWGYETLVQTAVQTLEDSSREAWAGDVLLYDVDAWLQSGAMQNSFLQNGLLPLEGIKSYNKTWSQPRFVIVLSSRSVSRAMLEQIGAVALLEKPFEMGRLQRYLEVLHRLVLAEAQGAALPLLHEQSKNEDGVCRVLVVDDDEIMARSIQQCLSCEPGYEVIVAYDGLEALEVSVDWFPHCVVTDLIMPWMNGYQVIRCLTNSSLRGVPAFVVVSALTQLEHPIRHSYLRGKGVAYVNKPFHINRLLSAIKQVCL
ncbi:MAG: response regulator [Chloroflexi bacterium]|nr:MAG: response regulator [Chloroflexota bacterium]